MFTSTLLVFALLTAAGPFGFNSPRHPSPETKAGATHRGGADGAEFTQRLESTQPSAPPLRPPRLRGECPSSHGCVEKPAAASTAEAQEPPAPRPTPAQPTPTPTPARADDAADDEVERVDVDLASVLLTAVDRERRFVNTLRREDIRVLEDGVEQQVTVFQRETDSPVSLAVLVDTSASQEAVMEDEKSAARAFIDSVLRPERDTAAVLSFTGIIRLDQPATSAKADLNAAIDRLKVLYSSDSPECDDENESIPEEQTLRCKTAVWDALWLTVNEVLSKTPERTRRAVILLSDGDDTVSRREKDEVIDFAVQHNTVIYAIGIRDEDFPHGELKRGDLRKISERTGGRAFFPETRAELDAAFAQINQELRSQYLVAYTPSNRQRDGRLRRVRLEVTNPTLKKEKLQLLYRQGYYAKKG
jgi:Ca-activated chloride channel homolog